MGKITIDLPDEIERRVRRTAGQNQLTVSRWIAEQVARKLNETWPPDFLEALDSCPDFPSQEELRSGYGKDLRRGAGFKARAGRSPNSRRGTMKIVKS